jgi:rSAM/selenodomain-associated transferase 2
VLSIIIPTLNVEKKLPATLACLKAGSLPLELIIADGGSSDRTPAIAAEHGAKFTATLGGRGAQMASGAMYSTGDWLLFIHSDTHPQPGWKHIAKSFIEDPNNRFHAAYFKFSLNDSAPAARRLERLVNWRCKTFGLPYGDQGLLISREFYNLVGGIASIPLMEDVDIVRRIGRNRITQLNSAAVTSAERYRKNGYLLRPTKNLFCLGLYFAGFPPRLIAEFYN